MKAIKLLLIAVVIIGAVVGLLYLNSESDEINEPEFTSQKANEWKTKINALCKENNWTPASYQKIETGIRTDNATSNGTLINDEEERILNKYLFALSCSSLLEHADKYFKQETYTESEIASYGKACEFLQEEMKNFEVNSNLTELTALLDEYHTLTRLLGFSERAQYSRPLKVFPAGSTEALKRKITGMKYYPTHFSHNASIQAKVQNLASERSRAEYQYYKNLEQLIEKNYESGGRIEELLDDQIRFNEISTNEEAIEKLTNFVNNPQI